MHEENANRDAEAAHVAAGGTLKEKNAEEEEANAKAEMGWEEKFLSWAGSTWLGQRPFMQSVCHMHCRA